MHKVYERAPNVGALLTSPGIITLTGGGGKTSLMYKLVSLLMKQGNNAVAATTTKIFMDDHHQKQIVFVKSADQCIDAVRKACKLAVPTVLCLKADDVDSRKAIGIPPEWLDTVNNEAPDAILVVEGDGSGGRSLKGHLKHEPVIPSNSKLIIPVIGLDVIGQRIDEQTVHRPQRFCELAGAKLGDMITERLVAAVLCHPQGYLQHSPREAHILPLLNKAETFARWRSAIEICNQIAGFKDVPFQMVLAGSVKQVKISVRILQHH